MSMRQIEIDLDVHRAIEAARQSFAESENDILRRALVPLAGSEGTPEGTEQQAGNERSGRSWTGKGVTLPDGTQVRMEHLGNIYEGAIADGKWIVGGKSFRTPSGAATAAAPTKNGHHASLNGWNYWMVLKPGEKVWKHLSSLREAVKQK